MMIARALLITGLVLLFAVRGMAAPLSCPHLNGSASAHASDHVAGAAHHDAGAHAHADGHAQYGDASATHNCSPCSAGAFALPVVFTPALVHAAIPTAVDAGTPFVSLAFAPLDRPPILV